MSDPDDDWPTEVSTAVMEQWTQKAYRDDVRARPLDHFVGVPAPVLSRLLDCYAFEHP